MTISSFNISYNQIETVLNNFGLFRMKSRPLMEKGISKRFVEASIRDNYFELYNVGKELYDFDFLLVDESYFQFEIHAGEINTLRYAFFQNPAKYCSYEEYVTTQIQQSGLEFTAEEIGVELLPEYEQYLNELEASGGYTTIRYDCTKVGYRPLVHSVAHFHIGHDCEVRIPIDKTISPLCFVLFIIKHVYYSHWRNEADSNLGMIKDLLKTSRIGEKDLKSNNLWEEFEGLDLYIS